MDEFEKCLRDYCESAVIGAGANDIGFFKDGARLAREWFERKIKLLKIQHQQSNTGICVNCNGLHKENQRLREALDYYARKGFPRAEQALAETEGE